MIKKSSQLRINVVVRPGSPLERLVLASTSSTVSGTLHDLAAAHEAIKEQRK